MSWYEAAAYADFAGKSLPTIYHWERAADTDRGAHIIPLSNFGQTGPARVGSFLGMSPSGAYDMAGNVKEWCWNAAGRLRYMRGGAWEDATYMFAFLEPRPPFDRSPTYGFRCIKYADPAVLPASVTAPKPYYASDSHKRKAISDEVFQAYRSLYKYDHTPPNAKIESVDDSQQHWRKEKVTFDAAYPGERMTAYLLTPKTLPPPFQTLVFFPGLGAFQQSGDNEFENMQRLGLIVTSGRAVLYPVYRGMFGRRGHKNQSFTDSRDELALRIKDISRAIDYLQSRADIRHDRLAYLGDSFGAFHGQFILALDERLKVGVLLNGGLDLEPGPSAEIDGFYFLPRIKVPVLMVNGRYDMLFPVDTSQIPCFRLIGTPEKDKRRVLFDRGHWAPLPNAEIREILEWLDHYLGPVRY